jgi:hypothetical protein
VILRSNGSLRGKPPNALRAKGVEKEEEEEEDDDDDDDNDTPQHTQKC